MTNPERQRLYEEQTRKSYELLGKFVADFELLIFNLRTSMERFLANPANGQSAIQALTVHLSADQVRAAYTVQWKLRLADVPIGLKSITLFNKDLQDLITLRNDLIHAAHFIGWASDEQIAFDDPTMLRIKPTGEGPRNRPRSISHKSMGEYISRIQILQDWAFAIEMSSVLNAWQRSFDAEGRPLPRTAT